MHGDTLLRLGEAPSLYEPVGDGEQLVVGDGYVLFLGRSDHPAFNTVQHLRLSPEHVDATIDDVRAVARARGRTRLVWEVATTATPRDLERRLRSRGMVAYEPPAAVIMAMREPPPRPPGGVATSRVETVDEYRTFVAITHEVFGMMDRLGAELERIDRDGARDLADTRFVRYLARIDSEPVAAATASFTSAGAVIHSGATRVAARGRGAYRALVSARWKDAVARGTGVLVTRSGPMSRPILRRVGFEDIAEICFLIDRFE